RDAIVQQLRATPEITIGELRKLSTGDLKSMLDQVTIGDLLGVIAPRRAQAQRSTATSSRSSKGARSKDVAATPAVAPAKPTDTPRSTTKQRGAGNKAKGVNTRTQDGRDTYDKAMLDALQRSNGKQVAAPELSAAVGGTPQQVRTSLARLIEAGKVTWTGQARGTRYQAV
ncbi:MAG: hypothetical protein KC636_36370, partial [Myxococcales bacterium]|nr:hypothetical protein [Myxococcales bacterium]